MTEFEYDDLFGGDDPEPEPEPEPETGLDAFLTGLPENEIPTAFIRIQSSAAGVRDIAADPEHVTANGLPGYELREVLQMALLTWNNETQFWAGETQVDADYVVPIGATITAIGVVKGG